MNKKIVWIEDDIDVIRPVVEPLEDEGYEIIPFTNAREALDQIETLHQADLILLDLLFSPGYKGPELGPYPGLAFLRKLRTELEIKAPVIIFSVVVKQQDLKEKVKEFDLVQIIEKPVRPSVLKETVEQVINVNAGSLS